MTMMTKRKPTPLKKAYKYVIYQPSHLGGYKAVYDGFIDAITEREGLELLSLAIKIDRPKDFPGHPFRTGDVVKIGTVVFCHNLNGWIKF